MYENTCMREGWVFSLAVTATLVRMSLNCSLIKRMHLAGDNIDRWSDIARQNNTNHVWEHVHERGGRSFSLAATAALGRMSLNRSLIKRMHLAGDNVDRWRRSNKAGWAGELLDRSTKCLSGRERREEWEGEYWNADVSGRIRVFRFPIRSLLPRDIKSLWTLPLLVTCFVEVEHETPMSYRVY